MRSKGHQLTRIDFIPLEHHEAGRRQRMIRMRCAGIGVLVVVMGFWIGVNRQMIASARAIMPEIDLLQKQIDIHRERVVELTANRATLDARRVFLEQLQQRISLVPILADVSERMPESVLLTRFSFNPELLGKDEDESRKPGATADAERAGPRSSDTTGKQQNTTDSRPPMNGPFVTINGVARTVPDILSFAEALERSKLLNRVEMQIAEPGTWAGKRVQQFVATCALVPQARSKK